MKNKKEVVDTENCYLIAAIRECWVILMESCAIVLLLDGKKSLK
jgi:hypothetical protein